MTAVLPTAKAVVIKGKNLVAVPHMEDEVRVLRNLGFDAPAPINSYYDYPGKHAPFIHQKVTAEFKTLYPRMFDLSGMGCIAGDAAVRVSQNGKSYEICLSDLYRRFHGSRATKSIWKARSLKGTQFGMNTLLDVVFRGSKPTLRMTLADGKTLRCTADHRIARPDGSWAEAGALVVGDDLVTNGRRHASPQWCVPDVAPQGGLIDKDGYRRVYAPWHPRANKAGQMYEHIMVAERTLGREISASEQVHHLDEAKSNNAPDNLEVLSVGAHHTLHADVSKLDGSRSAKGGLVVVLPKRSAIVDIEDGGETDVYDLSMQAPFHNFVVNGVVVHNSGKTLGTLWAFDYLRKADIVDWMLVLSPLSTLERAWGDEIFSSFFDMSFAIVHGTREKRHALLATKFDAYIINHDGIKSEATLAAIEAIPGRGLIVVDEIAEFSNVSTDRWKFLNRLINPKVEVKQPDGKVKMQVRPREWVWGLTGTPIPNAPTDAWAQARLISPSRVPAFFGKFRDTVMKPLTKFKWVAREDALTIVKEALQPAIRFSREECIDLPPTTYVTRMTTLTPEQTKAYNEMLRSFKTEFAGGQITAINAAVRASKLIQICCGVAYGVDGDVVIPAKARVDLVKEIIRESEGKVIVFAPLTGALNELARQLREDFTVDVVDGSTPKSQRDTTFKNFQISTDPHVLVANAAAMSHGLSLTAASTIVWFAPGNSNRIRSQANERMSRPGQTRNTLIVNIAATPLELKMYQRLDDKGTMQDLLLDLVKELK